MIPAVNAVMKRMSSGEHVLLSLGLMVPVVAVALFVLRAAVRAETPVRAAPGLREILAGLGWRSVRPAGENMLCGVLGYVMMMPPLLIAGALSAWIFKNVATPEHPAQMLIFGLHGFWDRFLLILEAVVVAPIVEETMFRGLLYPALRERWGVPGGIALSAGIFAIVHPTMPGAFLPLWTIGSALALAFERRDSLLTGMVMHAIQNGMAMYIGFALVAQ